MLKLAFSPCPNDTFIFDALVHHKIDTEGFDLQVLKGAGMTLKNTVCIIVEINENYQTAVDSILIQSGFRLVKTTICNCIWINEELAKSLK